MEKEKAPWSTQLAGGSIWQEILIGQEREYAREVGGRSAAWMILMSLNKAQNYYLNITFGEDDEYGICYPHDDPPVGTLKIASKRVARILIDIGSSTNILYRDALKLMKLGDVMLIP